MGGVVMAYYYDDEVSAPVATEAGCPPSDLLMGESSIVIGDATCEDDRHIDIGSETCYTHLNVMNYINLDCKLVKVLMFELPCETNCGLFCLPETTGDVAESIVPNPPPVGIGAPVGVGTPPVGVGTPPVGEPVGTPPVGEPVGTPPVGEPVGTPPVGEPVGTPPVGGEPLVMGSVRMNLANYGCTQITDECLDITIRLEHLVYEAVDYVWNFAEGIDRTVCKTIPSGNYRLRIDSGGDCLNTLQIRRNSTQLPNEPTALGLLILTTELGTPAETIISVPESASCSEAETFGLDLYVHQLCACPTLAVAYVYQVDECTQRIVAINANDGDLEYGWSDTNDIEDVTNWQTSPDFDFEENGTRWAFVRFATDHDCVSVGKAFPVECTTNPPVGVGTPPVGVGSPPVGSPPVGSPPVGSPPVGSPPVGSPPPVGTWEPTGDTLCIPYCEPVEIGVVIDFTEVTPPPPPIVAPLAAANADFYFTNGKYFDPLSNYDLRFTVEVETTGLSITGDSCNIGNRHIGGGTLATDYVISAFGRSQGASPAPPSQPYVAFYRFGFNLEKLRTDFPSVTFFRFKVLAKRVGTDPYNRYNYYGRMNVSTANELVTIANSNGVDFAFDGVDVVYTDYPTPPALEIVPAGASETLVGYIDYDTSTQTFVYQP